MDEHKLAKILQEGHSPSKLPMDENAQKGAANLALASFKERQKEKITENEKNSKGIGFLACLMDRTNKKDRSDPMEKISKRRMMYGGMATAMVALFVVGISVQEMTRSSGGNTSYQVSRVIGAKDKLTDAAGKDELSQTMREAIAENDLEAVEPAIKTQGSAIPTPISPPVGRVELPSERVASKPKAAKEFYYDPSSRNRADVEHYAPSRSEPKRDLAKRAAPSEGSTNVGDIYVSDGMTAGGNAMTNNLAGIAAVPPLMEAEADIASPYYTPDSLSQHYQDEGRDKFEEFKVNQIKSVQQEPVSTFSVDVDTASYSFVRKQLNMGRMPNADSVRVEELINYFDYSYALPETKEQPFKPTVVVTDSPWAEGKKLMHVGIKGYDIPAEENPRSNIVFLLDVSGSMNSPDKLPLLKSSMKMLLEKLGPEDTVAIAVYAGAAGTVLEPTKASEKQKIMRAIDQLSAGGSTAGAQGIELAYYLAEQSFDKDAVNRVILATDGDFNVGISSHEELKKVIEKKRKSGIFLSVLGFGQGNLNDQLMQTLAQNGNGIAAYIDSLNEARKVLVEEASSSLFPIAKDVKIQVEFNPNTVAEYRLVGYETRHLNREDFNNDKIDAGDIGAGHTVTAIYEITPAGSSAVSVDPLRYGAVDVEIEKHQADTEFGNEYAFLKIRYKLPEEDTSNLITTPVTDAKMEMTADLQNDLNWATAVAGFGQLLKGGDYTGNLTYDDIIALANQSKGADEFGYRAEFINLVRLAKSADAMQPR